jgi:Mg-chelatase subunit ChlD
MSALIHSLDNMTPVQTGENGHAEYGWSNALQEQILQFSFQLTRTDSGGVATLKSILGRILFQLKHKHDSSPTNNEVALNYLILLYKIIGQTRDLIDGKGECQLTYMMIHTWYEYYPELAFHALKCLVNVGEEGVHQYGSWKDIKYFCHYCLEKDDITVEHPLIQTAIGIINNQLRVDASTPQDQSISLVAKWIPREKSNKFGGKLYTALAGHYFVRYIRSSNLADEYKRKQSQAAAILKSKADYRKLIAGLNKRIDTLQIKQCGKTWADIDFNKVTSVSLFKQKRAFLNITKTGEEARYPGDVDRNTCAEHFNEHVQKAVRGETEMKGKRVGMNDFTRMAIHLNHSRQQKQTECDLLNSQWRDNSQQTGELGNFIAMVDVSGSMEGDPMHAAIALGIRIAEKSKLGKRVMTFSKRPKWVNLEGSDDFVSMVSVVKNAEWGMNTNFGAALELILNAIVAAKISPVEVQDMVLVILSDMQMDAAEESGGRRKTLLNDITQMYADTGNALFGEPYKAPHILFWNLRLTSGFPTTSNQKNSTMVSGFSPAVLNLFCEKGMDSLQSTSPWTLLESSLSNSRYLTMELKAREVLTTKNLVPVDYQELKEFLMPPSVPGYFYI